MCKIVNCQEPTYKHNLCRSHYEVWARSGGNMPKSIQTRMDENLRPAANGCHVWVGNTSAKGYGKLNIRRNGVQRSYSAHRAAWELAHGPIHGGLHVLHKCDNPPCCNVQHLYLGDNAQNIADRLARNGALTPHEITLVAVDTRPTSVVAKEYGVSAPTIRKYRGVMPTGLSPDRLAALQKDQRPTSVVAEEYGVSETYIRRHRRDFKRAQLLTPLQIAAIQKDTRSEEAIAAAYGISSTSAGRYRRATKAS